jgi:hypothetical protein
VFNIQAFSRLNTETHTSEARQIRFPALPDDSGVSDFGNNAGGLFRVKPRRSKAEGCCGKTGKYAKGTDRSGDKD